MFIFYLVVLSLLPLTMSGIGLLWRKKRSPTKWIIMINRRLSRIGTAVLLVREEE